MQRDSQNWSWIVPGLHALKRVLKQTQSSKIALFLYPNLRVSLERIAFESFYSRADTSDGVAFLQPRGSVGGYFTLIRIDKLKRLMSFGVALVSGDPNASMLLHTSSRLAGRNIAGRDPYLYWVEDGSQCGRLALGHNTGGSCLSILSQVIAPVVLILVAIPISLMVHFGSPLLRQSIRVFSKEIGLPRRKVLFKVSLRAALLLTWTCRIRIELAKFPSVSAIYLVAGKDIQSMALCAAARLRSIDVWEVQHGLFYDYDYGYCDWGDASNSLCLPTHFAAWSEEDGFLVQNNFRLPPENIRIVGATPAILNMEVTSEEKRFACRHHYRVGSELVILVCLNPGGLKWLSDVLDVCLFSKIKSQIVIRPHPDDRDWIDKELIEKCLGVTEMPKFVSVKLSDNESIFYDVISSDVIISEWSTVNLEAAEIGVSAIWYGKRLPSLMTHSPFGDRIFITSDEDELVQRLISISLLGA